MSAALRSFPMAIGIIAMYREIRAVKWFAGIKKEGQLSSPSSFT
jgi:predicted component of type VI protein secretion system